MPIDLVTKFQPYVDEQFTTESRKALLTNNDLTWTGAHTIKVYKINTSQMNDYDRTGTNSDNWSRYGAVASLDAIVEEFAMRKDRSFTFAIDRLDTDETAQQLAAASALARQNREVVIPEVDTYVYGIMCEKAGHKPAAKALTAENIYTEILAASEALDDAEVPETGRVLVVTPTTYALLKKSKEGHHYGDGRVERTALEGRDRHLGRHDSPEDSCRQTAHQLRLHGGPSLCDRGPGEAGGLHRP